MPTQEQICKRFGVAPDPPSAGTKLGAAANIRDPELWPVNGLRHRPSDDTNGWFIWAGTAPWFDATGAVGSSGAGADFRRLSHRLRPGHRLDVEPAVTQVDPHALAGLDVAREQPFR
jgi:hypothetical protein